MLRTQDGIHSIKVALLAERAVVEYDPAVWTTDKIMSVSRHLSTSHCPVRTPGNLGGGLIPKVGRVGKPGIGLFTNNGGWSCAITVLRSDCCPTTQTEVVLGRDGLLTSGIETVDLHWRVFAKDIDWQTLCRGARVPAEGGGTPGDRLTATPRRRVGGQR